MNHLPVYRYSTLLSSHWSVGSDINADLYSLSMKIASQQTH